MHDARCRDILISLALLGVVLTPLVIVVRDLLAARRLHRLSDLPLVYGASNTYPSLALLEDLEDTTPAFLRREAATSADPVDEHVEATHREISDQQPGQRRGTTSHTRPARATAPQPRQLGRG